MQLLHDGTGIFTMARRLMCLPAHCWELGRVEVCTGGQQHSSRQLFSVQRGTLPEPYNFLHKASHT